MVRFRCDGIEYKARGYLVVGHLFSIKYSKDVRRIRRREDVEILSVQLHSDPIQPATPPPELQVFTDWNSLAPLKRWLADWVAEHGVVEIVFPLNPKEREALLRQRRLRLSPDYLKLLEQCDGFSSQEHTVLGVASMYEVSIEEEVYWHLPSVVAHSLLPKREIRSPASTASTTRTECLIKSSPPYARRWITCWHNRTCPDGCPQRRLYVMIQAKGGAPHMPAIR